MSRYNAWVNGEGGCDHPHCGNRRAVDEAQHIAEDQHLEPGALIAVQNAGSGTVTYWFSTRSGKVSRASAQEAADHMTTEEWKPQ